AVRSDHADDPAAREPEAQVLEEEPIAVPLGEPGGGDDLIAEARAGRDHDLGLAELLPGILVRELLVRVEPGLALRLAGPRRHTDPLELALQRPLPGRLLLLLLTEPLLLLVEPRRVVSLPRDPLATVQLQDPLGD